VKKILLLFFVCLLAGLSAYSQGTVRGKVTDNLGETVIGANVVFKEDPSKGTITDFDGNFSLEIASPDPVVIVVSFISFTSTEITVNPKNGETIVVNVDLKPKDFELEGVEIIAKADKSGDYYMEKIRKNSATSIDFISNATMQRNGDSQVSAAIQRVPGVSNVGGNITVRGLADRYLLTSVNGLILPTLDPFTNNINLDIFPSGLVDNLVITKTGSPDLPGDWSGAFVSLETKDYPDDLVVQFNVGIGFNSNATFNDILSSQSSSTDWLGWDNGFRDIPDGVPTTQDDFPDAVTNVNVLLYRQYATLGLEPFLNSYGITSETPFSDPAGAYSRLALVELGFLGAGNFNNPIAIDNAVSTYNETYGEKYFFPIFNRELGEIGTSFRNNWFTINKQAPFNTKYSFTIGNQTKLFGMDFGFITGFRYARITEYAPDGTFGRTIAPREYDPNNPGEITLALIDLDVQSSRETANLSALFSGSLKINKNNDLTLIFTPSFLGENNARISSGFDQSNAEPVVWEDQFYTERRQLVYQAHSKHYIPAISGLAKFDFSYTDGQRNEPDFKTLRYEFVDPNFQFSPTGQPFRSYREMDDDILHVKGEIEIPVSQEMRSLGKLKFGGSYLRNERRNTQASYQVRGLGAAVISDRDTILNEQRFGVENRSFFDLRYESLSTELDSDIGIKNIGAVFAMADYNFTTRMRVAGGVRLESTDIVTDIFDYYDRDLPNGSPERRSTGGNQANAANINRLDVLPSITGIYKLIEEESHPMNLRLGYFASIARPSFRELSPILIEDYFLQAQVIGNPDLEVVQVNNFDLRIESYFPNGHSISISTFYKTFRNHIELVQPDNAIFTWQNAGKSYALGLEVEGQWQIIPSLEFRGNLSLIQSRTTVEAGNEELNRPMYGQAPYIINSMLSHNWKKVGLISTISYNIQGPKLALIAPDRSVPDVYEIPRNQIDIKLSKMLGEHFNVSFTVRDFLNTAVRRSYDFDRGYDLLDFDSFRWGTTYGLTVGYNL
jgi:outer membrane receptor protein involved in Fe transport